MRDVRQPLHGGFSASTQRILRALHAYSQMGGYMNHLQSMLGRTVASCMRTHAGRLFRRALVRWMEVVVVSG